MLHQKWLKNSMFNLNLCFIGLMLIAPVLLAKSSKVDAVANLQLISPANNKVSISVPESIIEMGVSKDLKLPVISMPVIETESQVDPKISDLGFIFDYENTASVTSNLGYVDAGELQRHVLDFDGGKLLYFAIPKHSENNFHIDENFLPSPYSKKILMSEIQMDLSHLIGKKIFENATNNKEYMEANHISIKNNTLILDNKDVLIDKLTKLTDEIDMNILFQNLNRY